MKIFVKIKLIRYYNRFYVYKFCRNINKKINSGKRTEIKIKIMNITPFSKCKWNTHKKNRK